MAVMSGESFATCLAARDAGVVASVALARDKDAARIAGNATDKELHTLVDQAREARSQVIEANLGLVGAAMKSLRLPRRDEDFYHDGVVALGETFNRFQAGGAQWSSFAYPCVRGGLLDAVARRRGESLNVSPRTAKSHHQYLTVAEQLSLSGQPVDASAVAEVTTAPVASVERLLARKEALSLDSEDLGRCFGVTDQPGGGQWGREDPCRVQLAEAKGISEGTVRRCAAAGHEQWRYAIARGIVPMAPRAG